MKEDLYCRQQQEDSSWSVDFSNVHIVHKLTGWVTHNLDFKVVILVHDRAVLTMTGLYEVHFQWLWTTPNRPQYFSLQRWGCVVIEYDRLTSWLHTETHRHVGQCTTCCRNLCSRTPGKVCCYMFSLTITIT